jgi:hypothetical protein
VTSGEVFAGGGDPPVGRERLRVLLSRLGQHDDGYGPGVGGTCYECPFASKPLDRDGRIADWREIYNDPTEAYFRCHMPGRTDAVVWGEYAPCTVKEWAALALATLQPVDDPSGAFSEFLHAFHDRQDPRFAQ